MRSVGCEKIMSQAVADIWTGWIQKRYELSTKTMFSVVAGCIVLLDGYVYLSRKDVQ